MISKKDYLAMKLMIIFYFFNLLFLSTLAQRGFYKSVEENARLPGPAIMSLVMICAVAKNEDLYIEEWIDYHFYLGFDIIQIYDNSVNASKKLVSLSHQYDNKVRILHYIGLSKQVHAYKNCIEQYVEEKAWVAFIDVDEFIVLRKHSSVRELLQEIVPNGGALSLSRITYGNNGHMHYNNTPVVNRFTRRKKEIDIYVKTIAYLPDVRRQELHFVRLFNNKYGIDCHGKSIKAAVHYNPNEDIAVINHYITKSYDEFRLKRKRGHAYSSHRNSQYHSEIAEQIIRSEFQRINNNSNVLVDTRARDFFLAHKAPQKSQNSPTTTDANVD